ncbi:MAG: hypothetical protein IPL46_02405 [Saprospiraceae bacterium]|nr:hypothetical protein [Saprospiraceae bacterium]
MYHKTIFSIAFSLFLVSCGSDVNQSDIRLNNGEKWEINVEMMPPLEASEKLISDFTLRDEKDYQVLSEKLKENNNLLISSCTMKGKSHDELHKWLHPYIGLLEELANAKNESQADQVFLKIEQSFETLNLYFQ